MTRPPVAAVAAYVGAALHAESGNVAAVPSSPAPLALLPPARSEPAAGVGIASPASAGSLEESNPDDLCLDAVRREMAKP